MEGLEQTAKLLELIRERGFKPGDKLPSERDLAALFGMSRSAVRESLIRLDTLRIVESRPKSGVYLQPYGAERSIEAMVLFARDQHAAVGGRGRAIGRAAQRARKRSAAAGLPAPHAGGPGRLQQILPTAKRPWPGRDAGRIRPAVPQGHRRRHQERRAAALHQRVLPDVAQAARDLLPRATAKQAFARATPAALRGDRGARRRARADGSCAGT